MNSYFSEMFSALKKLTVGGTRHEGEIITPPGLQTMPKILQSKFSKGVQYNSKCTILYGSIVKRVQFLICVNLFQ